MKDDEIILKTLRDHEKRIAEIESLLLKRRAVLTKTKAKSLPDFIIALRDSGFYSAPKTADETHGKLQENYHCEKSRVGVALLRLAKGKNLRKASKMINGKKYQAYVW
jgi:hypothetical protein